MTAPAEQLLRPAGFAAVDFVYRCLCAAVEETVGHVPEFKAQETRRFGPDMLRALIAANAQYVLTVHDESGARAGFIVSSPEQGNILLNWCYLLPDFRKGSLALRSLRAYSEIWQGQRFHKIVAYTKSDNTVTHLIMKRLGWREVCRLEKQFFGLDFFLHELPLDKALPGYEPAVLAGFKTRAKLRLRALYAAR